MLKLRIFLRRALFVVMVLGFVFAGWSAYFAWQLTKATLRPVGPIPKDFPFPMEAGSMASR